MGITLAHDAQSALAVWMQMATSMTTKGNDLVATIVGKTNVEIFSLYVAVVAGKRSGSLINVKGGRIVYCSV